MKALQIMTKNMEKSKKSLNLKYNFYIIFMVYEVIIRNALKTR